MGGVGRRAGLCAAAAAMLLAAPGALAEPTAPVLSREVAPGGGQAARLPAAFDPPRRVDGEIGDWRGRATGFGGSTIYSHGELVYQDHVFDAYGADNGQDVQRLSVQDPLAQAVPETYRLDPALEYLPGEFGVPTPGYDLKTNYGDLPLQDHADLTELHVGAGASALELLARTTTMTATSRTALLVLLDTTAGPASDRAIPFTSALRSGRAELALLLTGSRGWVADLATGAVRELPAGSVATNPNGYVNALEAHADIGPLPRRFAIAAITGTAAADGSAHIENLANAAFRPNEPVRNWWDKQQAFSLYAQTIDPFFADVDTERLRRGATERYVPGPGYHERLFQSEDRISEEKGMEGATQHYGVYLPRAYARGGRRPVQWWFHFRGGSAHIAAAAVPRIFKEMGEDVDSIVISPRGRGTSRWYVGKGQVDYEEVWADVHRTFRVDRSREYIAGHSMGGWASYLLPILKPDRFAASFPASGPVTQGGWTGVDFDGCDELDAGDGTTPCYSPANGGDARAEFTRPLLENLRWVPTAIYQGAADELVWVTGVTRQAQRFQELGFRYRYYLFPAQEHYGPPIVDQWADGVRYEHQFRRPANPPRVSFIRSMPMERAVERVQSDDVPLSFTFARAYWVSGLQPVDEKDGVANVDARSAAIPDKPVTTAPEAGGPAGADQTGPYAMVGQAWSAAGDAPSTSNAFEAKLTGARAVTLATRRMRLRTDRAVAGTLDTQAPLHLTLTGRWPARVQATLDGAPVALERSGRGTIEIDVPAGHHRLELRPS